MNKTIIAVSFGTACEQAVKNSVEPFEQTIRRAFEDYDVVRAYTSTRIVCALEKRGIYQDTLDIALEKLSARGCDEVILQPSLVIRGTEYDKICRTADRYSDRFSILKVGVPLIDTQQDIEELCRFFVDRFGGKSDATILMGHGSDSDADRVYSKISEVSENMGSKIFVVTATGSLHTKSIIPDLCEKKCRSVILAPFLFTAGTHAKKDMAGEDGESVASILSNLGMSVTTIMKGLGEYEEIRRMYVRHLQNTVFG